MVFKALLIYFRSEQFYSIMNPLSIESLAGHLRGVFKSELQLDLIDIHNNAELLKIHDLLKTQEYHLIGFSIMSYTSDIFIEAVKIADFKRATVVLGNQLATYSAEFLLSRALETENIKYNKLLSIKGEGELVLECIIKRMMKSDDHFSLKDRDSIPNIVYLDSNGKIIETEEVTPDLSLMPFPPHYMYNTYPFIQMQLSRGCYWGNCIFCTRKSFRMGKRWESFSMERIKRDLQYVISETNAEVIEFCDDEFFGGNSAGHIERCYKIIEIIESICKETNKKIKFRLFTRPDFIYTQGNEIKNLEVMALLRRLKVVGLSRIYIGIESGAKTQLQRYNRGVTKEIIENALNILNVLGIKYDGGFIMFDKSLTLDEMLESIDFYKKINLIESNQWIWRPMIANLGSTIGEDLKKYECSKKKMNYDTMEIKYNYDNKIVHHIQKIIDIKSAETRELFYALKVISKEDYDYTDQSAFNYIAHKLVQENGLIYVDFLYDLVNLIKRTDEKILNLVDQCSAQCDRGVFGKEDTKTLRHFMTQIKNNM